MSCLLEVDDLKITFKSAGFSAVKGVSCKWRAGEILGIVGESGSGKSVTALSIPGLLPLNKVIYGKKSSINFGGQQIVNADEKTLLGIRGGEIGFVFQEPMSSLNPLHRIGRQIAENIIIHQAKPAKQALREAVNLLKLTGIPNPKQKAKCFPHELSGGQRQRAMIAMAIANNPKLLIADEPTTALDVTIQAQIIDLLLDLRNKTGMAIIFISHDLQLVKKIADYICVMKNGEIVEQGSVQQIFKSPRHSYTKKLISSSMSMKCNINISGRSVLSARDIVVEYPIKKSLWGRVVKSLAAVDHVSLDLKYGECLGLVGESGSGKTTLGLVLCGLINYHGQVCFENKDIKSLGNLYLRKNIQIVFQDPYNSLNPRMTVAQIVGEGLEVHFAKLAKEEKLARIVEALKDVGLSEEVIDKYPHEFSGGQRQRIAIARALVIKPQVVVLDEPTSALDVTIQAQIISLLQELQKKYKLSYIFISHDMRAIKAMADRIAIMKDGKIVEFGQVQDVFEVPQTDYARELIAAAL